VSPAGCSHRLPQAQPAVEAGAGQLPAILPPGQVRHGRAMVSRGGQGCAIGQTPQADAPVETRRGELPAVGADAHPAQGRSGIDQA
jgi:hypothetical protein